MQAEAQAERLTSKHIKTLNYLQLILKQKGELENKIADLEVSYNNGMLLSSDILI